MTAFYSKIVRRTTFLAALFPLLTVEANARAQVPAPKSLFGSPLPDPNGFDSLADAADRYVPGLEGTPSTNEDLPQDENLRRQRSTVARNFKSLRILREGLQMSVLHTPVEDFSTDFGYYGGFRSLGTLLKQESYVRASNVDWVGAMNSDLDCIELGVVITRGGPLRAAAAGRQIESIGRLNLAPVVNKLSAKECRAAALRLEKIESLRPVFSDSIRQEKSTALALTKQSFEQLDWSDVVQKTVKPNGEHFTDDEVATLADIGETEVEANVTRVLNDVMTTADLPYRPGKTRIQRGADPWSQLLTDTVTSPTFRVDYEAARAQDWLLKLALELRASKLESGVYPETLETVNDPFADPSSENAKLRYRRDNDSYVLYSVGPDGKDDGGTPIPIPDGAAVGPTMAGDLVAPVFSQ